MRPSLVLVAGLLLALGAFVAALIHQSHNWSPRYGPLVFYWITGAALWALLGVLAWRVRDQRWGSAATAGLVITVAVLVRLVVVFACEPVLSDDIWRYLHDGATLAQGDNPYAHPPAAVTATDEAQRDLLGRINHPQYVTIYQPLSQLVFAGIALVAGTSDVAFRLGFVAFDLAIVALLLVQLRKKDCSAWWAALWAWHPLVISEVAGAGHQDVVGIACMAAAVALFRAGPSVRRVLAGGAALAAAVAVKPVVLPVALPIAWRWRGRPALLGMAIGAAVLMGVVLYGTLALMPGGLGAMLETSRAFVDKWAFNGSLHPLAEALLGTKRAADAAMAVVLALAIVAATLARVDLWRAAGLVMLAALLTSSTVHPWYVLWALVFVPVRFSAAAWVLSLTVTWSYAAHLMPEAYRPPGWVVVTEYVPVYGALLVALWPAGVMGELCCACGRFTRGSSIRR